MSRSPFAVRCVGDLPPADDFLRYHYSYSILSSSSVLLFFADVRQKIEPNTVRLSGFNVSPTIRIGCLYFVGSLHLST